MSILETQETFRRKSIINERMEPQYNGSKEFILVTDHRTSKQKSIENLHNLKKSDLNDDENWCQKCVHNIFRKKTLYKRLPILQWLPKYNRADAIGDLIAGITVGLTVIPQGLAYSGVAGLPTQFGLYGAFMGCFVYVLLGTCKDSTIGSTAVASLLTLQIAKGVWERAVLLTFLTGFIEILMAIFQLGFLVEFVSGPVSAGFTSAVALIVSTSQVNNILGVRSVGATFLQRWISMIKDIENIRLPDTVLGISCVTILLTLRSVGRIQIKPKPGEQPSWYHVTANKLLWFLGVTRNATLVIACATISWYLTMRGENYFHLTGAVPPGLPEFGLPAFKIEAQTGNETAGIPAVKAESFVDMVNNLGYGLLIIPVIALLENTSVCKAFAKGKPIDATQELIAIGVANIANSLCKGYRGNGGLARASVNNASGARTQMSNLYIGLVVVFALMYLTEYFYFIPKAVLGAIIISAVIFQVQYHVVVPMWRSKRSDLIPGIFAFVACLVLPLEIGILLAIAVNMLYILYHSARPKVSLEVLETQDGLKFLKLTPDRCLIFPSVEFVRSLVLKSGSKTTLPVVIDCTYIYSADYTAAKVITSMIDDFKDRDQKIIFFNLKPSVANIFEALQAKLIICYNITDLNQVIKADQDVDFVKIEQSAADCVSNASTITLSKF